MKRKIHFETIFMLLLFSASICMILIIVFSPLCLTYTGTLLFLIVVIVANYSGLYLYDRYEKMQ